MSDFCYFIESLCGTIAILASYGMDGFRDLTLPRSWLLSLLPKHVDVHKVKNLSPVWSLVKPLGELIHALESGADVGKCYHLAVFLQLCNPLLDISHMIFENRKMSNMGRIIFVARL